MGRRMREDSLRWGHLLRMIQIAGIHAEHPFDSGSGHTHEHHQLFSLGVLELELSQGFEDWYELRTGARKTRDAGRIRDLYLSRNRIKVPVVGPFDSGSGRGCKILFFFSLLHVQWKISGKMSILSRGEISAVLGASAASISVHNLANFFRPRAQTGLNLSIGRHGRMRKEDSLRWAHLLRVTDRD
jgi:hypothetical protein